MSDTPTPQPHDAPAQPRVGAKLISEDYIADAIQKQSTAHPKYRFHPDWVGEWVEDDFAMGLALEVFHELSAELAKKDEALNVLDNYITDQTQRIAELEAILARIDQIAPRADDSCLDPGVTLSEAVRRALKDEVDDATN